MNVVRAATVGDMQTVKKWLSDPPQTKRSTQAWQVLVPAANYGYDNICELMLDSGQVTDDSDVADALALACAGNKLSTARLFVRRRRFNTHDLTQALSDASLYGQVHIVVWLMSDVIRVSQADRITWLLITACARGDMRNMRQLAAHVDTDFTRVMSHALRVACYRGRGDIVEWLTSHTTADVSSFSEIYATDGKVTSLMAACMECKHDIARRLVECITPHTVNLVSGRVHDTALHFTISSEIIAHHPLTLASMKGDIDGVESSLYSSKVNDQVTLGRTALHLACWNGHVEIVRLLLSVFARTDIADDYRHTPAMWAEYCGQTHVLPLLQLTVAELPTTAVPVSDNNNSVSSRPKQVANLPKSHNGVKCVLC